MRAVLCVVLTCQFSVLCQENQQKHLQISSPDGGPGISLAALNIERDISKASYSPAIELKGNVEIRTALCGHEVPARKMMVLRADVATYHEDSGQIEASGNVRVNFEPLR
jgi:lipopolysaccharide assembly outer membrane protein LptD (OstA)